MRFSTRAAGISLISSRPASDAPGIVPSADMWHACRSLRNRAAHDYGTDFELTAAHFNAIHDQVPMLTAMTLALADYAKQSLEIVPHDPRFADALATFRRHPERLPSPPAKRATVDDGRSPHGVRQPDRCRCPPGRYAPAGAGG
jgi:hypothetical protein